jgi:hypothetical protein
MSLFPAQSPGVVGVLLGSLGLAFAFSLEPKSNESPLGIWAAMERMAERLLPARSKALP